MTLYTDSDPFVCEWVERLIARGLVSSGDVWCKDIREIRGDDIGQYTRVHLFCGIAGWERALQLAEWPTDRPVWTGSCPCQPFSSAARGRQLRVECDRHLWPHMRRLITEARPPVVFGEQVAHARDWLDGVCDDMEAMSYTVRACVLPAYSIAADHARERIYFACNAHGNRQPVVPVDAEVARLSRRDGGPRDAVPTHGVSAGVARVRGAFGNSIVPQVAAEFAKAFVASEAGEGSALIAQNSAQSNSTGGQG